MDVGTLLPGDDFVTAIQDRLADCDVMLAVIGRRWLNGANGQGTSRLNDEGDYLRVELQTALDRAVLVVPVLVEHAMMPRSTDLPNPLRVFARRQAAELRETSWVADVGALVQRIKLLPLSAIRAGAPPLSEKHGDGSVRDESVTTPSADQSLRSARADPTDRSILPAVPSNALPESLRQDVQPFGSVISDSPSADTPSTEATGSAESATGIAPPLIERGTPPYASKESTERSSSEGRRKTTWPYRSAALFAALIAMIATGSWVFFGGPSVDPGTPPPLPVVTRPMIETFVQDFDAAASTGNVDLMTSFFAEKVNYFGRGGVPQAEIRQDKQSYFKSRKVAYTRQGEITIVDETPKRKRVTYTSRYEQVRPAEASGTVTNTLVIELIGGQLKIVSMGAKVNPDR